MPSARNSNIFIKIRDWLTGSWGAFVTIILTCIGAIFGFGYFVGSFVTKNELNNTIINMRLDQQKELAEEKGKAKDEALKELKDQNQLYENFYNRLKKDLNK